MRGLTDLRGWSCDEHGYGGAGLDVVAVPAMAASEALVYDRTGCYLVVAEEFRVTPSRDYAPAYQRDSVALRTSGQLLLACPGTGRGQRRTACRNH